MSIRSRSDADARPVRTVLNESRAWSTDFPIRVCASLISWSAVAMRRVLLPGLDDGTHVLTRDDPCDVAVGELEDVNRELVVHAERQRGRIHHLETALDGLEMRQPRDERRGRVLVRVAVVDAADAVLRHEDCVGADLERTQRRRRVGREEGVAGAGGKDDDAPLLEMPDRAAPDIRLRNLAHLERRLHARLRARAFERVLQRERIEQRREHACVVGGRALHPLRRRREAAVEVAAADDDRHTDAALVHRRDLACQVADDRRVDAVVPRPHQGLARELQEDAGEAGGASPTLIERRFASNSHPATENRWKSTTSAPDSLSAWPTVFEESWIHSWSTSTFAPKKRLLSIPSTIFSRACSGFDCTSSELM